MKLLIEKVLLFICYPVLVLLTGYIWLIVIRHTPLPITVGSFSYNTNTANVGTLLGIFWFVLSVTWFFVDFFDYIRNRIGAWIFFALNLLVATICFTMNTTIYNLSLTATISTFLLIGGLIKLYYAIKDSTFDPPIHHFEG